MPPQLFSIRNGRHSSLSRIFEKFSSVQNRQLNSCKTNNTHKKLPEWLQVPVAVGKDYTRIRSGLRELDLRTICEEGRCPNIGSCWSGPSATATIMIMGSECTRACRFCSVKTSRSPKPLDPEEPQRVATAIASWSDVTHVVITTVDRDDLVDGGASHFSQTISLIKEKSPQTRIECLVGDFQGNLKDLEKIVKTNGLDVLAHNVECVERLTSQVRDRRADYRQSLNVLEAAKKFNSRVFTKSSIMLGLGEKDEEIFQTMRDLRLAGVECLTIGQYMRPTRAHMAVTEYVRPEKFEELQRVGMSLGFAYVASGPLVRSSYRAGEYYTKYLLPLIESKSTQS